jgi:hypothetical protein
MVHQGPTNAIQLGYKKKKKGTTLLKRRSHVTLKTEVTLGEYFSLFFPLPPFLLTNDERALKKK